MRDRCAIGGVAMAKGRRGGRQPNQQQQGRRGKKDHVGAPSAEAPLPTAAPGSAGLPSSIMGGGVSVNVPQGGGGVRRPELRRRNRGGPRPLAERAARGPKVVHDFRYVRGDLHWIAITSGISVVTVLVAWAALRG